MIRVLIAFSFFWLVPFAHAENKDLSTKPLRIVVIVAPGGAADSLARLLANEMGQRLRQTVIVENKPGASGNLATQYVARSAPDGYTVLLTANNHTINPSLFASAGYAVDDLAPVVQVFEGPSVIAVPAGSPFNSLKDLLDAARENPGGIAYGTAGVGLSPHISMVALQRAAHVKMSHVAYRGSGPSITDALSGVLPVISTSLAAATPHIDSGKLKALAVTSLRRWPSAPNIPAVSESGLVGYEQMNWLGLFVPKGTPASVITRLHDDVDAVLLDESVKARIAKLGGAVTIKTTAEFARMVQKDYELSTQLVREAKLTAD